MDLKKKLALFVRLIRVVVFLYVLFQYLILRQYYRAAYVIPVLVGLGIFYVVMDRIVFGVPEKRFKQTCFALMFLEMFLVSLLLYFTRSRPVPEFDLLYALPVANVALWFGLREGMVFGALSMVFYVVNTFLTGRFTWSEAGRIASRFIFFAIVPAMVGYLADYAEKERKEKSRRMVELTALSGFATVFESSLIEEKVYQNLAEAVARSIGPDVVLVFRLSEDEKELVAAGSFGLSPLEMGITVPRDFGVIGDVLDRREPLLLEDTDAEPGYRQILESRRIRSAAYAPLKWRDELYGIVVAGSETKYGFHRNDLNFISALAVQAAVAIHNSRLYSDLEDRIGELHAIFEIDKAITSAIDLETVLQQIVQMSIGLLGAKISSLMLLDEENQELVIAAAHGLSERYISKGPVKVGQSIAGRVIKEGRPIAVEDIREDPRHVYSDFAREEGLCSLLSVPLSLKDKVIGVLNIYTEEYHKFTPHEINLFTSLASQAAIAIENARLFESLEEIYLEVITALASAIDARDAYTHGHSTRVTEYAVAIAEEMGLPPTEVDIIRNASILHDVGKIGIRENILKKDRKLTRDERREMQYHPLIGARILQSVRLLEPVLPLVYHHHEWYDGSGYPDGLRGEEIPLGARIIAVADAFESMTSDRPYRKALPLEEAVSELQRGKSRQFDPNVVDVFLRLLEEGKIGLRWRREEEGRVIDLSERFGRADA